MSTVPSALSRREFLKTSGALTAAASLEGLPLSAATSLTAAAATPKMIGLQIGAVSFVDEGVEPVLDTLQSRGAVNTVFLTTFSYGRGLAGRQIPGQPFPDHGVQQSDEQTFHGGNYAMPHPEFYQRTVLKQTRAPDFGDLDILAVVLPKARQRGLKLFCSCEDVWRTSIPGFADVAEVDIEGRKTGSQCLFHPDVREFWRALATDYCRSYDIDGILFFNERNGPLLSALGASHAQAIASGRVTCFCAHHQAAARELGIDMERARQGYRKLDQFVRSALAGQRPSDGYFVEFWRLLFENPEILAWDRLFDIGKHQVLADVHRAVKAVRPQLQVGFHIEHVNSFNPIFRATRRYDELAAKADFLKVVVYNNCGGERYAHFIENVGSTVFRDVPKDELLRFNNHLLNYGNEAGLAQLPQAGLSPDYVARETHRALAGVQGKCRVLPGIDIGIPTGNHSRKASADDTYAAVAAALKANADGVILSRKYSEMRLANLTAAGQAVKEYGG
ncbi:MAG TPA: twin-arginine translocation signal domain-containing protein [Verrucomicrobiae bacterium]|nr:twin-arginine translocation signal domain-containing protein [Verrucomicrobiae bacterium]